MGPAAQDDPHEIVGVARSIRHHGLIEAPLRGAFDLYGQHGGRAMALMIRSLLPASSVLPLLREELERFDQDAPLYAQATFNELARGTVADRRTVLILLAVFAALALLMSIVGIYGVVAQSVRAQLKSFGIQMALGAVPHRVSGSVVRGAVVLASAGVFAGALASSLLTRAITGLLYGVEAFDPRTFVAVAVLLLLAAIVAAAGPAWRASRTDISGLLRDE
jgi:ABC-type antimicrobial peptide transport system permease subunit